MAKVNYVGPILFFFFLTFLKIQVRDTCTFRILAGKALYKKLCQI